MCAPLAGAPRDDGAASGLHQRHASERVHGRVSLPIGRIASREGPENRAGD